MNRILEQILTNQLCILATLKTLGIEKLQFIQITNIEDRINETFKIRKELKENNK